MILDFDISISSRVNELNPTKLYGGEIIDLQYTLLGEAGISSTYADQHVLRRGDARLSGARVSGRSLDEAETGKDNGLRGTSLSIAI